MKSPSNECEHNEFHVDTRVNRHTHYHDGRISRVEFGLQFYIICKGCGLAFTPNDGDPVSRSPDGRQWAARIYPSTIAADQAGTTPGPENL